MSAISGMFHRGGKDVRPETVGAMLDAMAHRAPDGRAIRGAGLVCLGHGALHTTPESLCEFLPRATPDGLFFTGDLRLDNRHDLAVELGIEPVDLGSMGDGELVMRSFRRWGREVPGRLEGAFAFAIWDQRRQELFCARDHFGAKPFVYFLSRELFVFASEVEGVLAAEGVPRRVNEVAIADFLARELEGVDRTSTLYRDILKLPAATSMTVDRNDDGSAPYWAPDPSQELRLERDEEYVEMFRAGLDHAVGTCLVSSTPPAVLLSGGIDSGAVAAVAVGKLQRAGSSILKTFSVARDRSATDRESECIRSMVEHLACESTVVPVSRVPALEEDRRRAGLHSRNFFDCMMTVPDLAFRELRSGGSRVVLDGVDGDVVLALGSAHITQLMTTGQRLRAFWESWAFSRRRASPRVPWAGLVSACRTTLVPERLRGFTRQLRRSALRDESDCDSSIIDPDFARRVDLESRFEDLHGLRWFGSTGQARQDQARSLTHPYVTAALERYDRVASRHGVEVRHPLLSTGFVQLCLSLPWHLKMRDGWTKYILRRSMEGMVPERVCWRSDKRDVLWAWTSAILAQEGRFIRGVIEDHRHALAPYVNLARLRAMIDRLGTGVSAVEEESLWCSAALALWLDREGVYHSRDNRR